MKLWKKMFIGLGAGLIVGLILGPKAIYLKPVGSIFLSLLNMLVIPLIFASLTVGITSISDIKKVGRLGFKAFAVYLVTTVIAITIGLCLAKFMHTGDGLNLIQEKVESNPYNSSDILKMLTSLVPQNPISAMASGHILQVILFSILFGIAITLAGEKGKKMKDALESLSEVMFAMTRMVMKLAPYGIFAIMAWVAGTFGVAILVPLLKFVLAIYLACIIQSVVVFGAVLTFLAKLRPWNFFKGVKDVIAMAASTTSSSATLPTALHCVENNLGVSKNIANFILPLGIAFNMNGTAIFQAMSAIFVSQAYGIDLGLQSMVTILLTATLASIGCAGIPGSGLVTLSIVLASVGLPLEGIAIIAGIDRVRDIICTVTNILGDSMVAVYVAKSEGELDIKRYNNQEALPAFDKGLSEAAVKTEKVK